MALINTTDKSITYKYRVSEFIVVNGAKQIALTPANLISFSIEHQYETSMFPLFRVLLQLDSYTMYYIISHKNDIKFKITVRKYNASIDGTAGSMYTNVFSDTFITYLDSEDINFDTSQYKKRVLENGGTTSDNTNALGEMMNEFELFLFKESAMNSSRSSSNMVLKSSNISTAISYALSKAKVNNALMSPLDNTESYSELLIPPFSLAKTLMYFDYFFGLYKRGALIYFGFNRLYILKCDGSCSAYTDNEWKETVMLVPKSSSNEELRTYSVVKPNHNAYYIHCNNSGISSSNQANVSNLVSGSSVSVSNTLIGSVSSAKANVSIRSNSESKKYITNDTYNKYVAQVYSARQKEKECVMSVSLSSVNIDAFEPNKTFSFIFEDTTKNAKFKGKYRICECNQIFTKSGEDFSLDILAKFVKCT